MPNKENNFERETTPLDLIHEIRDMPEAQLVIQIESLDQSIYIFERNYQELRKLIEFYSIDRRGEHLQYLRHRDLQFQLGDEVVRLLHNFVASALSLIDHTRNLVRHLDFDHAKFPDYQDKVDSVFKDDPVSCFVKDLRVFCQHYKTPPLLFETKFDRKELVKNLGIQKDELQKFDKWSSGSKKYLQLVDNYVDILAVANEYHERVDTFYTWFNGRLEEIFETELAKYREKNELLTKMEVERHVNACIANPQHFTVENTEFLAGYLTTAENQQIGRLPYRERADLVIKFLKNRCELSEEYEKKIHVIYRKDILGRPMSERFEDFLVRYTHDARGDMVPIDYYDLSDSDKNEGFILLGKLEVEADHGGIGVYVNKKLLFENGLPEESIETVAAHEILHFSFQLSGFPCTKTPRPMPKDSTEAIVGSKLQCVFQEVPILHILENCGFNIREVTEMQNKMQLKLLKNSLEGEPEKPGSAGFAMSVLSYIEVQLVGSESTKKAYRDLIVAKNSLVVKYGDKCLSEAAAVDMLKPEGQLFAFRETIKTLGLKDYVVAVDGRKSQSV